MSENNRGRKLVALSLKNKELHNRFRATVLLKKYVKKTMVMYQTPVSIFAIVIFLDNCSFQNKNWSLFSFFLYFINSSDSTTDTVTIKYFEPGYTFMSADLILHQIEQYRE